MVAPRSLNNHYHHQVPPPSPPPPPISTTNTQKTTNHHRRHKRNNSKVINITTHELQTINDGSLVEYQKSKFYVINVEDINDSTSNNHNYRPHPKNTSSSDNSIYFSIINDGDLTTSMHDDNTHSTTTTTTTTTTNNHYHPSSTEYSYHGIDPENSTNRTCNTKIKSIATINNISNDNYWKSFLTLHILPKILQHRSSSAPSFGTRRHIAKTSSLRFLDSVTTEKNPSDQHKYCEEINYYCGDRRDLTSSTKFMNNPHNKHRYKKGHDPNKNHSTTTTTTATKTLQSQIAVKPQSSSETSVAFKKKSPLKNNNEMANPHRIDSAAIIGRQIDNHQNNTTDNSNKFSAYNMGGKRNKPRSRKKSTKSHKPQVIAQQQQQQQQQQQNACVYVARNNSGHSIVNQEACEDNDNSSDYVTLDDGGGYGGVLLGDNIQTKLRHHNKYTHAPSHKRAPQHPRVSTYTRASMHIQAPTHTQASSHLHAPPHAHSNSYQQVSSRLRVSPYPQTYLQPNTQPYQQTHNQQPFSHHNQQPFSHHNQQPYPQHNQQSYQQHNQQPYQQHNQQSYQQHNQQPYQQHNQQPYQQHNQQPYQPPNMYIESSECDANYINDSTKHNTSSHQQHHHHHHQQQQQQQQQHQQNSYQCACCKHHIAAAAAATDTSYCNHTMQDNNRKTMRNHKNERFAMHKFYDDDKSDDLLSDPISCESINVMPPYCSYVVDDDGRRRRHLHQQHTTALENDTLLMQQIENLQLKNRLKISNLKNLYKRSKVQLDIRVESLQNELAYHQEKYKLIRKENTYLKYLSTKNPTGQKVCECCANLSTAATAAVAMDTSFMSCPPPPPPSTSNINNSTIAPAISVMHHANDVHSNIHQECPHTNMDIKMNNRWKQCEYNNSNYKVCIDNNNTSYHEKSPPAIIVPLIQPPSPSPHTIDHLYKNYPIFSRCDPNNATQTLYFSWDSRKHTMYSENHPKRDDDRTTTTMIHSQPNPNDNTTAIINHHHHHHPPQTIVYEHPDENNIHHHERNSTSESSGPYAQTNFHSDNSKASGVSKKNRFMIVNEEPSQKFTTHLAHEKSSSRFRKVVPEVAAAAAAAATTIPAYEHEQHITNNEHVVNGDDRIIYANNVVVGGGGGGVVNDDPTTAFIISPKVSKFNSVFVPISHEDDIANSMTITTTTNDNNTMPLINHNNSIYNDNVIAHATTTPTNAIPHFISYPVFVDDSNTTANTNNNSVSFSTTFIPTRISGGFVVTDGISNEENRNLKSEPLLRKSAGHITSVDLPLIVDGNSSNSARTPQH